MKNFTTFLLCILLISCSFLPQNDPEIKTVVIAIPPKINPLDYWPNSKDISEFYGEPTSKSITKHGEVHSFDNVPGCDLLLVYFETDSERGYENLVSSMTFVSVSVENNLIKLGANTRSYNVSLSPLVIDAITYKNRFDGIGSSVRLMKQNDGKNSIIISWE